MSDPVLEVRDLSFSYGDRPVLAGVSLSLEACEYLSVIGPNGAGKTTLLKCLIRILRGATGTIRIAGKDLKRYRQGELAKLVGYVPQAGGLEAPYTVREFVMMGRYPYFGPFSPPGRRDREAVDGALDLTGMQGFDERIVGTLSGGERQKALIAAAVAQEPRILLLDEPTTFLDPFHRREVAEVLRRLHADSGVAVVSVTHDINHALLSSQRVLGLRRGSPVYLGPARDLLQGDVLEKLYDRPFLLASHPETGRPFVVPD